MAREDYDIASLSAYLHQDPVKVRRMAERGKIPGRRVGGEWRFSRGEIHHWLEQALLGSDQAEATRIETVLDRTTMTEDIEYTLESLLVPDAIAVPLEARTKNSVITTMSSLAADTGWLWDPDSMSVAVREREDLYPTAMDGGLALMHPRRPLASMLGRPFVAFGRTSRGIPYGAPGGGLTDLFFLILSTDDAGHLRTLARLGRVLGIPGTLDEVREAPDSAEVLEILLSRERGL
jgi:PTS system nitrogen regulatory IIA component